jgi:NTP pyrophosphatase (non-canonical NTP hydrolase)
MDWKAVKEREKEVIAIWKPRAEETPPRYSCYDCTSEFIYELESGLVVESIRQGVYGWDEPDKIICLCAMHRAVRQANEAKYDLTHLNRLQIMVGNWGESVFESSTPDSIMNHLAEEMVELLGEERVKAAIHQVTQGSTVDEDFPPSDNPAEESADILLMLLHLAHRLDYDLMEATLKKFAEVRDAEWADDGRGYKKRVKK